MKRLPSAFWACLGTNEVSVPTNIVVNFYLTSVIGSKVGISGPSVTYRYEGGPRCVLG